MQEFHADIFVHGLLPVVLGFVGLICLRYKAVVPGVTCWTMALGIFLVVANKYGIDALGQIAAIDIIWTTIFCIGWAFFGILGVGVRATTRDLPRGDWGSSGGGRRYTVSGDPNEPPPANPETYRQKTPETYDEIPQIAPSPVKEEPRAERASPRIHRGPKSRFSTTLPRSKR